HLFPADSSNWLEAQVHPPVQQAIVQVQFAVDGMTRPLETKVAKLKLVLDRASDVPLYRQVAEQIHELIRCGALPTSSRLPTVRALAQELGLTRLTIQSAYTELQAQGLVEGMVGRGTFVTERPQSLPTVHLHKERTAYTVAQPPSPWLVQGILAELVRLNERADLISFAQ